jgi:hypothetical protein
MNLDQAALCAAVMLEYLKTFKPVMKDWTLHDRNVYDMATYIAGAKADRDAAIAAMDSATSLHFIKGCKVVAADGVTFHTPTPEEAGKGFRTADEVDIDKSLDQLWAALLSMPVPEVVAPTLTIDGTHC